MVSTFVTRVDSFTPHHNNTETVQPETKGRELKTKT